MDPIPTFRLADIAVSCENVAKRRRAEHVGEQWYLAFSFRWDAVRAGFLDIIIEKKHNIINECFAPDGINLRYEIVHDNAADNAHITR